MENLEKIEQLLNTANKVKNAIAKYIEYQKNPSKYDKIGFGFNLDDRFAAHRGLNIRIDSWVGTYGNSGSSTIFSVDSEIFNGYLHKAISANKWMLLEKANELMIADATKFKDKAKAELEAKLEKVNAL